MTRTRLLITGINGLIGGILNGALRDSYDLYGLDRAGPFSDRVLQADIADYRQVADAFRRFGPPDSVVHLAADPNTDARWESVLHSNIVGTRNVYEAAREFSVRRIVFASSNHVTGAYEGLGHFEAEKLSPHKPIRPDSDYGVSKAFGEATARHYCSRWKIESVCLRIGTVRQDDDPTGNPRYRKTWLSHRDLVQLVRKSLSASVEFGIYYGVSNNDGAFWDISNAHDDLGYVPQDNAAAR